jgi:TRAP transporter TAXI family solute receptor
MMLNERNARPDLRLGCAAILGLALGTLLAGCGGSGESSNRVVNIVTAPPGGGWYVVGGVMSSLINEKVPNVMAIPESTGGAEENVRLVGMGQSDLGFVIVKTALQGYRGEAPFAQSFPSIRLLLTNLEVGALHVVVNENSPLKDVCELKGKRLAVGPSGHGSLSNLREIFSAGCGFTFDDISPVYLPYDQSLSALGDSRVDAAILYVAPPVPSIAEFGATHAYRLLPVSDTARDAVAARYPYYEKISVAAGTYAGVAHDVPVVGTANGIMVNADLPEDLVYEIAKATFENIDRIRASYPTLANFSLQTASQNGMVPFHDGAIRYYREQGVWQEPESNDGATQAPAGAGAVGSSQSQ